MLGKILKVVKKSVNLTFLSVLIILIISILYTEFSSQTNVSIEKQNKSMLTMSWITLFTGIFISLLSCSSFAYAYYNPNSIKEMPSINLPLLILGILIIIISGNALWINYNSTLSEENKSDYNVKIGVYMTSITTLCLGFLIGKYYEETDIKKI